MTLGRLAKLIRSKNAGPFVLTIDIMFDNPEAFEHVVASGIINKRLVAELYGLDEEAIDVYVVRAAYALKVSMPRPIPSGGISDSDIFGGQQYAPLVELEVPAWNEDDR